MLQRLKYWHVLANYFREITSNSHSNILILFLLYLCIDYDKNTTTVVVVKAIKNNLRANETQKGGMLSLSMFSIVSHVLNDINMIERENSPMYINNGHVCGTFDWYLWLDHWLKHISSSEVSLRFCYVTRKTGLFTLIFILFECSSFN